MLRPHGRFTASQTRQASMARGGRSGPSTAGAVTLRAARGAKWSVDSADEKTMDWEGIVALMQQDAQVLHLCTLALAISVLFEEWWSTAPARE